ncbi:MAG: hypothetical protein JSU01_17515 [Bacteroidetes bacterium]|nr:hypothetical protein [Bacteroidota bacterium]
MPAKQRRLIFELSAKEKENKLRAVLYKAINEASAQNLPFIYKNELCIKPSLFIHKYPNGREVLIEQDSKTFSEKTITVLR